MRSVVHEFALVGGVCLVLDLLFICVVSLLLGSCIEIFGLCFYVYCFFFQVEDGIRDSP